MKQTEELSSEQAAEDIDTRRQLLARHARKIGHGALGFAEDWNNGVTHAATGGRRGMTMMTSRRLRHENASDHPDHQVE